MPETVRQGGPRKTHFKKRTWRPKKDHGKIQKLQKEVMAIKRELKTEVEVKNYDFSFAATNVDYNGIMTTNVLTIVNGTGQSARVGTDVTLTGFDIKCQVANPTGSISAVRCMVVIDKKNALTALSTFFAPGPIGTVRAPLSFYNRNFRNDFIVLYDKIHELEYLQGNLQQYFNIKSSKKFKIVYDNTSFLCNENALKLVFVSNIAPAGSMPTVEFEGRAYYTDQ